MPRLALIFLHSANGGGCFRWRDEDSTYLQSEHDPCPEVHRSEGQNRRGMILQAPVKITSPASEVIASDDRYEVAEPERN